MGEKVLGLLGEDERQARPITLATAAAIIQFNEKFQKSM
jgi:hypothetical protein